ncbi:MAG: MBL fold metallo-hydrolase, partial [Gammaproteobacteria bacterium]|nr:rhodanese-like domain-containing protein [Gemmatimonadota bacterium]NIU76268.1 MBL fold metallo-hydrolase [Gammaproteobacteria bacterium]NIY10090.1 MBL fold metallo-hydrolase [Gemmatimonadota bacterium]
LERRLRAGDVAVLDVRGRAEWEAGRIPDVPNLPVGYLPERLDAVPRDKPLVVHCQSGARSLIAASLLRARGFTNVINLKGGYGHWQACGNPVE